MNLYMQPCTIFLTLHKLLIEFGFNNYKKKVPSEQANFLCVFFVVVFFFYEI